MAKVIPFEVEHASLIEAQEQQNNIIDYIKDNEGLVDLWEVPELSYSVLGDYGELVFCGGVLPLHKGVGETWSIVSIHFRRYAKFLTLGVRDFLDKVQYEHKFHRLQMTVDAGFKQGVRWGHLLGFEHEGLMKQYGASKRDAVLFGRVRDVD